MTLSTVQASLAHARKATTFIFGGHIGPQSKQSLEKHVRHILQGPNAQWILDTVAGLPQYWDTLVEAIPEVAGTMEGARLLADLAAWLRHGGPASEGALADEAEIPVIWIGPLMIAIQLDQYWRFLQFRFGSDVADPQAELQKMSPEDPESRPFETVGFCAGMIAAVAVASAHNRQQFEAYGAAAVRIGTMMAALVGAGEAWDKSAGRGGGAVSLATAWRSRKQGDDMARIVASLSSPSAPDDAYVSVLFDEARATVTTSARLAPKLARQLRAAGVKAIPLAFQGKLHAPGPQRERHTEALIAACHASPLLRFPDAADLALPTYIDHPEGKAVAADNVDLVGMVLRSILARQLNWASTVSRLATRSRPGLSIVAFGLDRPLPPTLLRSLGPKQAQFEDLQEHMPACRPATLAATPDHNDHNGHDDDDDHNSIAVVGMSLQVAGADDLDEFEAMIKTGQSQHEVISHERMTHEMLYRDDADADANRTWYGNFLRDPDAFDHKFFKRSPREAKAIDPQGRLSMQAAYRAVAQSGYFADMATTAATDEEQARRKHVGVYVGLCSFEYEINIARHQPTAFTATGGLRSFIPGRLSHYFGWTGPSLTLDTACSSSTVALHTACRDLLSGDVSAALCGGVNVLTNLEWTQNLAAGSFISPTGQCKPFDSAADGYCRGDGIAYVFLKRLSTARAEGNPILGTIRATGVNQNLNTTPLFVPNVPSLSTLFRDVIRKAHVSPKDISLVECHGTGTPVGDPAEYESIRQAVAGPLRDTVLPVGSIKGHVGHTEGASGIVSLIKVLTMMRGGFIPPQASFQTMNPHIHARPEDNMEVVTSLRPWHGDRKVALVNNYGACGSNGSFVVAHAAHRPTVEHKTSSSPPRFPFFISGLDVRSIADYAKVLAPYVLSHTGPDRATLADLSFNMARQSNPSLPQGLLFSCSSFPDLQDRLSQAASAHVGIAPVNKERPVILCFGGQVSKFVGLDRALYDGVAVLRMHLHVCDAAITAQGLASIFPAIFSCEPIQDVVTLQTALFAMQYAAAQSWLDCGLAGKVVSVVGHSFGEITALCVAGVLSLQDTVKLIAGRAQLVRDVWGPDSGAMMAIEADEALVLRLLEEANRNSDGSAAIACYNGPRSFTLAGSTAGIDAVVRTLADNSTKFTGVKSKRLNVTNAFHSTLVEKLVGRLDDVGRELTFDAAAAVIPIERATENGNDPETTLDWRFVASHMRQPVFFHHALQRLVKKHPQAVFLEAGSNSTITVMAKSALSQSSSPDELHFQSVAITNTKKGIDGLTDATVSLWKQGLRVAFWAHHHLQTTDYAQLLLPPYQFEKSRHWLENKSPSEEILKAAQELIAKGGGHAPRQQEMDMWTFLGYQEPATATKTGKTKKKLARFRINTASDKYQRLFSGHVIALTAPICPATLEIDMAVEALFSLNPDWRPNGFSPVVHDMLTHSPMCADSTRVYYLDLEVLNRDETEWYFTIRSVDASSDEKHAEGRIQMCASSDPAVLREFGRYERLVTHAQCQAVLKPSSPGDDGVEAILGLKNVYRAFEGVVDFSHVYHGVRYVVGGSDGVSAGVVHKRHSGDTWLDVPLADSFGQVAGMYVNLLTQDLPASDMCVATGIELVMRSPTAQTITDGHEHGSGLWNVYARHERQPDNKSSYLTDVFVFDAETGKLAQVILGLKYVRVAKATMSKILSRMTKDKAFVRSTAVPPSSSGPSPSSKPAAAILPTTAAKPTVPSLKSKKAASTKSKGPSGRRDIANEVRNVVASVSGIEASEMSLESEMADLGIDSLMGMELAREVENTFACSLDQAEQMAATSLGQFVICVANALARAGKNVQDDDDGDDSDTSDNSDDSGFQDASHDKDSVSSGIPTPEEPLDVPSDDTAKRQAVAERLVAAYTKGWTSPALAAATKSTGTPITPRAEGATVIVTGATGSLGSHLVQVLAQQPEVATVVCINRPVRHVSADRRQADALSSRGITLSAMAQAKLRVYDADTSLPQLGLAAAEYAWLVQHGTHIIHNAWPMSGTRPLAAYESQIQAMRNLLDLARDMATTNATPRKVGFEFVSSIGVTGFFPGQNVPEQLLPFGAAIPSGYNEGKWVCEHMLQETLRQHPRLFRASVVRPGQITGSTTGGVWNPVEHFPFLVKSAQALKAFPDLRGVLHWLPVDKSASVMVDLLKMDSRENEPEGYPVYHVDNPVGQPWKDMSGILAAALDIPADRIIPFPDWVQLVRQSPLSQTDNPAARVIDFLEGHFERMACGGVVLDTERSNEHSKTMAAEGPVSADVVRSYVSTWKTMGFLE